ncbi:MAG: KPN_02809 family neutral zinc metallopeptidase [Pseudomonadales bacterium]
MKWRGARKSTNVEDRRGRPMSSGVKVGGGIGGLGIVAVVIMLLMGGDPMQLLGQLLGGGGGSVASAPTQRTAPSAESDALAEFASVVLADTEETWRALFKQYGSQYRDPTLVLYTGAVQSACGRNSAATGPFYCPGDQKLYLDTSFFNQLSRMGAPGDFASAYVIGHEVAHHVQNLTGVLTKVRQMQSRVSKTDGNALQVLVELQADCYAGVWANHAERQRDMLDQGDVEEGLRAAASIGDDHLQKQAGQRVRPESFTHGSSEQRVQWFRTGISQGDVGQCDTFASAGVRL